MVEREQDGDDEQKCGADEAVAAEQPRSTAGEGQVGQQERCEGLISGHRDITPGLKPLEVASAPSSIA